VYREFCFRALQCSEQELDIARSKSYGHCDGMDGCVWLNEYAVFWWKVVCLLDVVMVEKRLV
jgi:hypothetical protein